MRLALLIRQRGAQCHVLTGEVVELPGQLRRHPERHLDRVLREPADFRHGEGVEGRTTAAGGCGRLSGSLADNSHGTPVPYKTLK
ncbi:hypothetical protein ACW0JT_09185 [Arthrobacter sp. SA17]